MTHTQAVSLGGTQAGSVDHVVTVHTLTLQCLAGILHSFLPLGGTVSTGLLVNVWMTTSDLANEVSILLVIDEHDELTQRQASERTRVKVNVHTALVGVPRTILAVDSPRLEACDVVMKTARCGDNLDTTRGQRTIRLTDDVVLTQLGTQISDRLADIPAGHKLDLDTHVELTERRRCERCILVKHVKHVGGVRHETTCVSVAVAIAVIVIIVVTLRLVLVVLFVDVMPVRFLTQHHGACVVGLDNDVGVFRTMLAVGTIATTPDVDLGCVG